MVAVHRSTRHVVLAEPENKAARQLQADTLEQQVGPEYEGIIEGLDRVDPNSAEGQKFVAVFNTLQEKCK